MVSVLFPVEWLVVHADTRATAVGIGLLALEAALGLGVFLAVLKLVDPEAVGSMARGVQGMLARLHLGRTVRGGPAEG